MRILDYNLLKGNHISLSMTKPIRRSIDFFDYNKRFFLKFPRLLFIIQTRLKTKHVFNCLRVMAVNEELTHFTYLPLPNIFESGRVCLGNFKLSARKNLQRLHEDVLDRFWQSSFNGYSVELAKLIGDANISDKNILAYYRKWSSKSKNPAWSPVDNQDADWKWAGPTGVESSLLNVPLNFMPGEPEVALRKNYDKKYSISSLSGKRSQTTRSLVPDTFRKNLRWLSEQK